MKRFLPVIHRRNDDQVFEQVHVALEGGADGVWLIDHTDDATALSKTYGQVRAKHPDLWIGLNFLDLPTTAAVMMASTHVEGLNGLWADNGGVKDNGPEWWVSQIPTILKDHNWHGEYFGGVAFKGQDHITSSDHIEGSRMAAAAARDWMDVVCTSGRNTGVAPATQKVQTMKEAIGDKRLALASGVTCDNLKDFLPYVDDFMVATGVSSDFHHLDPERVKRMAELIHASP